MNHINKMIKQYFVKNYKEDELQVVWDQQTINQASTIIIKYRNSIDLLMGNKKISLSNLI
jgi:hypothetical protein